MNFPPIIDNKKWYKSQEEALENADGDILAKWGKFHFTTFSNQNEFINYINETNESERCYFEVLKADTPQRMFADLDGEGLCITREELILQWELLMISIFNEIGLTFNKQNVRLLNSAGEKISLHWSYIGLSFHNSDEQKEFWKYVEHIIETKHTDMCFLRIRADTKMELMNVLDISVYSKNRAMRTIYSHKAGSDRVLNACQLIDNHISYLIKYNQLEYLIYDTNATEFYNMVIPEYTNIKKKFITKDDIKSIIKHHVPNTELFSVVGRIFKLRNIGTRVCIINGEENTGDNSYVVWRRDGLYFGCHDSNCEGHMKQIHKFETPIINSVEDDIKHEMTLLNSMFTDGDVSDYIIAVHGCDIHVDPQSDDIYLWKTHYWLRSDENVIGHLMDTVIYKKLKHVLDYKFDKATDFKKYIALLKCINNFRNCKPQKQYISAIIQNLKNTQELSEFDINHDLVCFKNGVYDLEIGEFRNGKKTDYCSQVVPYDWSKSTRTEMDTLMCWINQIMPLFDERDCLLKCLSSCLTGRLLENIIILTGKGRNGKDTLITGLLHATLGNDNYYNNSTAVITQTCKGGISQEKANMHKKRAVIYSEPSREETLKCAILKEITGCPELTGRGIYSKTTTIKNHSTNIIHANAIPNLDYVDDAIANRLVIVLFRSLFRTQDKIDEFPTGTANLHLVNSYYKSAEFLEKNRLVFMNILIKYYDNFKEDKYIIRNIPATMQQFTKSYMSESDDFVNWFNSEYEYSGDNGDYIKMCDVYTLYRNSDLYANLNKREKRRNSKKNLIKEIENNPNLKPYFLLRREINGHNCRNIIIKHKVKDPEDEDDDDDDENEDDTFPPL
jgi:phage/plasmid-associated DNA primase